jgi:hypothetical protein
LGFESLPRSFVRRLVAIALILEALAADGRADGARLEP